MTIRKVAIVKPNGDVVTVKKEPDLCVCGPLTRATHGCECGDTDAPGHPEYRRVLNERIALHVSKSAGYGTNDDSFANFTAVARMTGQPRYLYPVHRTIEKLTRVLSLHGQGRVAELEEEFKDCSSLLDCATAMLREDQKQDREVSQPV